MLVQGEGIVLCNKLSKSLTSSQEKRRIPAGGEAVLPLLRVSHALASVQSLCLWEEGAVGFLSFMVSFRLSETTG